MADNEDALPGEQIEDTGGEDNAADKDESLSQNDLDNEGNAIPDNQAQEGATTENHVLEDATVENQLQEGGFLVTDDVTSGNQVQEVPENQFQETATSENQVLDDVTLETRIQEYATPENQVQEILQVQEVQEVETLVNQGPAREIAFSTRQDYVSGSEESETESESEIIKKWPRPRVLKTLQHARSRKFTLHQPEGYKERQVRMKELRQLRIASIKAQQKIILERVAAIFNIEFNEVLDGVVDSDDHMWLLDSFIAEGGTSNIIVCYASLPAPSIETGRFIPNLPNTYRRDRVFLAETRSSATFGDCVAIYRTERKSIEIRNVEDDVFYARFKSETNVVCSMFKLMERICVPALNATKEWGGVGSGKVNDPAIELHFRSQLKMFLKFMAATSLDIESCPQFTVDMSIYDDFIHSDEHSFEKVAKDIPVLTIISNYVKIWSKQISMVLVQSKQIRKEATDAGPLAELEHWRRQLVIFTSIVEHLKSSPCVMYISTLTKANSKLIKKWNVLVKSVTDSCNEAADNVKYLYSLEKYYEPLYSYDPIDMIPHLPGLMYTIRMIFSTSCYYNTKERIASLIVKVTNQIINSCIIFLSDNGKRTIWKQDKKKVIAKAKLCIQLYENYRKVYNETQTEMIEAKSETPFKCSETIIFGKFENLKKRLLKVIELFDIYIKYYVLNKTTIEGIEEFAMAFNKLYKTIATKEYDALDYRAPDFDNDYDTFKAGVAVQEFALNEFMNNHLRQCPTTEISQSLLERFCRLRLDCLRIEDQYFELIKMFTAEMEALRDKYNMDRDDPSLPWNMTPIAGRIYWIRCFYERIHQPMLKFQEQNNVIRNPSSQKCIKLYNSLLLVFIEYEQRYHSAWKDHMGQVKICFTSPLLLRQPSTRMIVVNFNPYILECMREIKYMRHLGLDMPNYAEVISSNENNILRNYELLKSLIDRNYSIRRRMPKLYLPLLKAQLVKIDKALQRGLSVLNWESLGITEYCDNLTRVLNEVDFFLREAMDMQEARIDTIFKKVSSILFVYLPEDAVTPDEFLAKNLKRMDNLIPELQQLADIAENAVEELILKCLEIIPSEEIQNMKNNWYEQEQAMKQVTSLTDVITDDAALYEIEDPNHYDVEIIRNDCNQLFAYFNTRMVESLVKATKDSLETLKQRAVIGIGGPATNKTLLKTAMKFNIPNSTVDPSIELIQTVFSQVITTVILNISRSLFMWGQAEEIKKYREKQAAATVAVATASKSRISVFGQTLSKMALSGSVVNINIRSYYRLVSEHKEVVRCMMSLQGAMIYYMGDVDSLIKKYLHYSYLWAEDRDDILREFVNSQPLLITIQEKFKQFEKQTDEVLAIPNHHIIGPLTIEMHDMKLALHAASTIWKLQLGKLLNVAYRARMLKVVEFINDHMKILKRKLKDLDDVRLAMNCLESIREHFFEMDMEIDVIVETYDMFTFFNVHVTKEDKDTVDSLRFKFQDLLKTGYSTQETINELQEPLQQELMEGVASLIVDIEKFESDYESKGPMAPGLVAREASDRAMIFQHRFEDLWRRFEMYSSGEKFFGMKVNEYPQLHQRKKEFTLLGKLYGLYLNVLNTIDAMFEIKWKDIDIDAIIAQLADFDIKCKKLPKGMKDWPAYIELKKKIDDIYDSCPLLEMMANKAMKERHWHKLEALMDCEFDIQAENFILKKVIEAPLLKHRYDVEDICVTALKEKDIEAKLKQVISDWAVINLSFQNFKARGELLIKAGETTEIITLLEDSLMILNSLASNRYNVAYKKEILLWISTLVNTSEILEKWLQVQNLWMYLEAVFVGGDIAKQLPGEAKKFAGIDKKYVKIMYRARDIPNAVDCCTSDATMKEMLPLLFEQLEACQKSLTGYLETKRLIFPRFFFVSDPVLLEILGQSSDPRTIQPHLLSLFDAVAMVDFDDRDRIIALNSDNGEKIELDRIVDCIGGVEVWLNVFLASMIDTVKTVIAQLAQMMKEPNFNFMESFIPFNAQAALLGVQLLWTKDAEYALKKSKIDKNIMRWTNKAFLDLLNSFIELTVKDLTKLERIRFETMVTIHVHQRDIFDALVRMRVKTLSDFEWQKQARFYYHEETDMCTVGITNVNFIYQVLPHREHSPVMQRYRFKHYISEEGDPKITNEYLGVTERLAITPLTDRCYITLAQAIGLNMGGAPAGPAGTGKTETTKDMGRCLGKLVVVFNCSDQMDFRGLGRIYKGLAQSGSWGCFDEFNRIELPVLSVAAQQIYICLTARKEKKTSFIFSDGDTVPLNPEFGFFITMNPGYAGRQELPENLKIQFRSVAMMVPDKQIIMRVKLASCGFKDNIVLARKFFTLYKLCEEQLSKQVHYDFGLRNILSVLRTLGAQKRANPESTEETIVMRVLKDMNVSKLVDEDEPLFLSLIDDLFPGLKLGTSSYKDLQKAIAATCTKFGLVNHPDWNLKIIQLYETSLVRHGLMVLGPTGAGKTKCIQTLLDAFTELGKPHKEMRMNPKAITASQMFGRLDFDTNDWTDGIFSTLWRRSHKIKKNEFSWIVLDGPVDAVWIENLNSVLDDNKTLTLANGDRIVMAANCKLVIEPDNVDNASPATISRVGMTFISSSVMGWQTILQGWLNTRNSQEVTVLGDSFNKSFFETITFIVQKLFPKMNILEALYVRQACDILSGLLESGTFTDKHLERLYLFSLMWSLGAVLELDDRKKMMEFCTMLPAKLSWPKIQAEESIFDYFVNEEGVWQHWSERLEEFIYPDDSIPEYASILVPNVDNVRTAFLIDNIAKQNKCVLLIGEQGTAKTVMLKSYMAKYDPEVKLYKCINFSSATSPNLFQRIIESYVEKKVGTTFGPPGGRMMTVFIDDINMPIINEWGDQITNEIVRQLMECTGFFSLDKPGDFNTIVDIQIFGAMIHPGGGRNDIPPRLKRQFNIFNCTLPSVTSMDKIFGVIAGGYFCLSRFPEFIVKFMPKLVELTRATWQNTKVKMLPTPAKFHYVFNLRDLSRIWEGILKICAPELPNIGVAMKLWYHECMRVIADRFTNTDDRDWFVDNLRKTAESMLSTEEWEQFPEEETFFVNFMREAPEYTGEEPEEEISTDPPKVYEEVPSFDAVQSKLEEFMANFNESIRGQHLNLVLFRDAMIHLLVISRIINTHRGNALLVGVGGSGKQSLTKLASFIAGYVFYQISLSRSYNLNNFMEDIKHLYRVAGLKGSGISFIFTDNDINDEAFLEYLNNILSSGEIANLFPKDEMDEILSELTPIMRKFDPKRPPTPDVLYEYFIIRSRANLHIALCFSPVGEKFRNRALKFPGLISGCTMDWFHKWPKEALIAVANHFLSTFPMVCTPEVKVQMIKTMSEVQDGVSEACVQYFERFRRQTYVTPKSYLSFLDGYKTIYTQKFENINMLAMRMSVGLTKLKEASTSVDALKRELEPKKVEILAATVKAEAVLAGVAQSAAAAEVVKREVLKVKERAVRLVEEISADQAVAAKKLEAAEPALRAAEAALETIRPADIATVKKLGKPPFLITLIMDCVGILFRRKLEHVKPDPERRFLTSSWSESLKIMGDVKFMSNLMNFPKDGINGETCDLLYPYFNYESYTFEAAKSACGNVAGLISWTLAMEQFYLVNKDVLPLKANLAVQQSKYNAAKVELNAAEATLAAKEAELAEVQKEFDNAMRLKSIVLEDARACQEKMDATMMLIDGLSGERVRWTEQSALFQSEIERLIGDVLLLTGFLSYAGPFNQEFRNMLNNSWIKQLIDRKIPVSTNLNISDQLADSLAIAEWNLNGLPNDELSIQNGIIATKSSRFPLLIDPQIQGKTWIENTERENGLIVTSLTAKYFRNNIEDAVSLGIPILIVDIGEELDPSLDNVLERNFIKVGNSYKVKVGDKEIDVSDNFRLYFTTQLSNPAYTPEIYARCSIIDFTVTVLGLEDQLLGRVIRTEKAELEVERTQLITSITANKRKMQELESNLLHKLTTIQGSLVEDVSLIQTLNVTKATATDVKEKLDVARETEIKINLAREEFRPVATRGCILYFLVCNMSMVCCMYQTSLAQFLERFDISMERSQKNAITLRRLNFIIEYLTFDVFKYISRGFYESHKYMFVLLMTLQIDLKKEYISYDECQVFIKGGAALNLKACPVKPHKWISDLTWLNLVQLSFLRLYQNLLMQITNNEKLWKSWFDKEAPEEEIIPDGYNGLDVFRKLLVIRAWCPDRTLAQSRKYVISSLGQRFIEPVLVDYKAMVGESRALVPLIGFLAMGSDPTPSIETTAKRLGFKCSSISMGQGQEIHARKLIQHAVAEGEWVLLQNCHLSLDYMSELLILFVELEKKPNSVHTDFRVWITTEVAAKFPISLLQISIKFTSEPPAGMRAGLIRTYSSMNQDLLDHSDSPFYLPTIFGLSFLHTVVQERRKFGPLGWNIPYEFNSADWLASCMFVQNHLDELDPGKSMSWTTTRYMIAEVHYGGRVTDDYDKRLLNAFSKVWFSDNLFSDEFNFYKGYEVMKFKTTSEYLQEIEEMKTTDPPQVYGLNSNANITYQSNTTRDMLETILSIQPKEASIAGGETREANVARQTQEMLDKLPLDFKPHEVKEKLQLMGLFNSMTIFLRQEIDWMQKVITLVRGTLRDLLLAIEGTIIMNESLRDALDNIFDGRVPRLWLRGSWESSSIGFWITELLERHAQFAAWCFAGRPIAFRMAGFFNPQGFLTAMRQEVTRAHKGWALDKVALHNDVTKFALEDLKKPPQEGVFVHGLFLDGAGWDRRNNRLCESAMKVLYANMPIIHIFAINSTSPKDPKLYQCPVYKKAKRTDLTFITPLWLMTIKAPEHWVLRGVAILCDIK